MEEAAALTFGCPDRELLDTAGREGLAVLAPET